ncbi:MAG: response regulator, partial [Pseudomonadales bacterium]|nr:response regulator [Pseudomonadales bacterium]
MTDPHFLLVEDDDLLAEQTARALGQRGVRVTVAHQADDALNALHQCQSLDGAILDQNLGRDNGLELITPIL